MADIYERLGLRKQKNTSLDIYERLGLDKNKLRQRDEQRQQSFELEKQNKNIKNTVDFMNFLGQNQNSPSVGMNKLPVNKMSPNLIQNVENLPKATKAKETKNLKQINKEFKSEEEKLQQIKKEYEKTRLDKVNEILTNNNQAPIDESVNPYDYGFKKESSLDIKNRQFNKNNKVKLPGEDLKYLPTFKEAEKSENIQEKMKNVDEQTTKLAYLEQNKNAKEVEETKVNWFDKSFGRVLSGGLSLILRDENKYKAKDKNGKILELPTKTDLMQQKISNSYDTKTGKFLGDAGYNIGKQLGAVAGNAALPGLGTGAYWLNMFMENERNARIEGYDSDRAALYAATNTLLEFGTEKVLGGLTKGLTGGKSSALEEQINKATSKLISNETFSNFISKASSEAIEEFTQEYLDNINKLVTLESSTNIADYRDVLLSTDTLSDALYSAGVGAVSGGTMGAFDSKVYRNNNINNQLKETDVNQEQNTIQSADQTTTDLQNLEVQEKPNVPVNENTNNISLLYDLDIQIDNALNNTKSKSKNYLGKVSEYVAEKINKLTGIDVRNRKHVLTDYDIRHMINQHGNQDIETTKGQIAINKNDIKNIPDIISNPTDIVKGTDNKLGQTIRYIKKYNDNSTYVVEVVPDNSNTLIIKTMWKKPSTLTNSIATPSLTSVTQGSDISSTTNNTILQSNENVNSTTKYSIQNDVNNIHELDNSSFNLSKTSVKAKDYFGTTNDFSKAGYIIENGEMLNFSDGNIQREHSDIDTFTDMENYIKNGGIRIGDKSTTGILEMGKQPTNEQLYKIMDYVDTIKDKALTIELIKGENNLTLEYDNPNSIKVKNDIKNFYTDGIIPTGVKILNNTIVNEKLSLKEQQDKLINSWINNGLIDNIDDPSITKWIKGYPDIFPNGEILQKENKINLPQKPKDNLPKVTNPNLLNKSSEIKNTPLPMSKEVKTQLNKKVLDPIEISKLVKEDASTTPSLPGFKAITGDGKSKFFSNVTEKSKFLKEDVRNLLKNEDDIKYYKEITNKETLEKAYKKLQDGGANETLSWFNRNSYDETGKYKYKPTAEDVVEGWILLKQYQDAKDYDAVVQVAKKMREIGTQAGQTVQAFNIMERMTPEGMVKYAQSELSEAYDKMVKNKSKEWIDKHRSDFDLKPDEVEFIMNNMKEVSKMEDGYDKRVKLAEIQKLMTDKLPAEKGKAIKSWMRISMLFNPKTQVRNVVGNALIMPVNNFSDLFSSYADKLISKKTGVRTTGKVNVKAQLKGFKEGAYQATNDYRKGINTKDMEGNRFEIGEGKSFNNKRLIGKSLNRVEGLLNYVMDAGDRMFSQAAFENSLQNQLILNNTTEITQDMIDIARTESLQRTWNDNNNYTKFVLDIRRGINKIHYGQYGLGDVLIPFAKTPANLTKAIVDYSPAGLVNTVVQGNNLRKSIYNGQFTPQMQHKFVQTLGKATAGTMLYILGAALAKAGITTGDSDEDKDTANFLKNTLGVSSYSINIGGKSFTYDWAQPLAAPLSITANIVNSKNKKQSILESIVSNLDTAGSILLEQSFLQSINDVFNGNEDVITNLINEMLELPARAIPTFSKQIVDMTDSTQRTSYEYGKPLQTAINSMKAKIPGLSKTLAPSVDTMGREIQRYGGKNNIFNVFLNPANVNTENISESAEEIYRLYKSTGDKTIMPRVAPYYINSNEKVILTSQEKAKYQKISGKIIEDNVKHLMNDSNYKKMNDDEKTEIIKSIVDYSYNKAREEVKNIPMSKTYNKINEYVSNGGKVKDYYLNKEEINYSLENPAKYKTITQITTYEKYQEYKKEIDEIRDNSNNKKMDTMNYINSLKLNIPQKAMFIKMYYSSFNDYDDEIISYINKNVKSKNEKENILSNLGFTIRDGKVYTK